MNRLAAAFLATAAWGGSVSAQRTGFTVISDSGDGGWTAALTAVNHRPAAAATANVFIVRHNVGTPAMDWQKLVNNGAYLVIEGASPLAALFGFRGAGDSVVVRRELDERSSEQVIFWEKPVILPRVAPPAGFRVFSRDRWSGVPLLAGRRIGRGAVLWAATSPGPSGFERLPYVLQALADLGLEPRFVGNRLQIFFDYAYRTRADPEYLAAQWRRMGISRLFVSSWYFFERDAARDRYLATLIDAAHRNGITAFAWLELPHVSQRFWEDHPEWREKNGYLQDALVDWRKNMNLLDPHAFAATASLVTQLLEKFDWDGVTLSELYFEGTGGVEVPASNTPFNDDVRTEVRNRHGFDPGDIFNAASPDHWSKRPDRLQLFRDYRMELQRRLHERFLDVLVEVRNRKGSFAITVCYVDDISEPRMRNFIGADVRGLLPVLAARDVSLLVQDPFELWGLGPDRYRRIAAEYKPLIPREKLAVDINIVTRKEVTYPTQHQTGNEFFLLVHTGQREFSSVALYAENSILAPDLPLLPAALSAVDYFEAKPDGSVTVESPVGVGVRWKGEALVNGAPWPYVTAGIVWLPAGRHTVAPSTTVPRARVLDFTGDLVRLATTPRGLTFDYTSDARAILTLPRAPMSVSIDGVRATVPQLAGAKGRVTLLLPSGARRAEVVLEP